jgi:hypothetical protein
MKKSFMFHPDKALVNAIMKLTGGNPDNPSAAAPPSGYKPSNVDQRNRWNAFLDFLDKKGMGGNTELDKRDRTRGLELLNEFNRINPKMKVDPAFIPTAQYESQLIRKQKSFPGLTPEQSAYAFKQLSPQYLNRPISEVDNWLGSYTSKQYYPTFIRKGGNVGPDTNFGTDFEGFSRTANPKDSFVQAAPGIVFRK